MENHSYVVEENMIRQPMQCIRANSIPPDIDNGNDNNENENENENDDSDDSENDKEKLKKKDNNSYTENENGNGKYKNKQTNYHNENDIDSTPWICSLHSREILSMPLEHKRTIQDDDMNSTDVDDDYDDTNDDRAKDDDAEEENDDDCHEANTKNFMFPHHVVSIEPGSDRVTMGMEENDVDQNYYDSSYLHRRPAFFSIDDTEAGCDDESNESRRNVGVKQNQKKQKKVDDLNSKNKKKKANGVNSKNNKKKKSNNETQESETKNANEDGSENENENENEKKIVEEVENERDNEQRKLDSDPALCSFRAILLPVPLDNTKSNIELSTTMSPHTSVTTTGNGDTSMTSMSTSKAATTIDSPWKDKDAKGMSAVNEGKERRMLYFWFGAENNKDIDNNLKMENNLTEHGCRRLGLFCVNPFRIRRIYIDDDEHGNKHGGVRKKDEDKNNLKEETRRPISLVLDFDTCSFRVFRNPYNDDDNNEVSSTKREKEGANGGVDKNKYFKGFQIRGETIGRTDDYEVQKKKDRLHLERHYKVISTYLSNIFRDAIGTNDSSMETCSDNMNRDSNDNNSKSINDTQNNDNGDKDKNSETLFATYLRHLHATIPPFKVSQSNQHSSAPPNQSGSEGSGIGVEEGGGGQGQGLSLDPRNTLHASSSMSRKDRGKGDIPLDKSTGGNDNGKVGVFDKDKHDHCQSQSVATVLSSSLSNHLPLSVSTATKTATIPAKINDNKSKTSEEIDVINIDDPCQDVKRKSQYLEQSWDALLHSIKMPKNHSADAISLASKCVHNLASAYNDSTPELSLNLSCSTDHVIGVELTTSPSTVDKKTSTVISKSSSSLISPHMKSNSKNSQSRSNTVIEDGASSRLNKGLEPAMESELSTICENVADRLARIFPDTTKRSSRKRERIGGGKSGGSSRKQRKRRKREECNDSLSSSRLKTNENEDDNHAPNSHATCTRSPEELAGELDEYLTRYKEVIAAQHWLAYLPKR